MTEFGYFQKVGLNNRVDDDEQHTMKLREKLREAKNVSIFIGRDNQVFIFCQKILTFVRNPLVLVNDVKISL